MEKQCLFFFILEQSADMATNYCFAPGDILKKWQELKRRRKQMTRGQGGLRSSRAACFHLQKKTVEMRATELWHIVRRPCVIVQWRKPAMWCKLVFQDELYLTCTQMQSLIPLVEMMGVFWLGGVGVHLTSFHRVIKCSHFSDSARELYVWNAHANKISKMFYFGLHQPVYSFNISESLVSTVYFITRRQS